MPNLGYERDGKMKWQSSVMEAMNNKIPKLLLQKLF